MNGSIPHATSDTSPLSAKGIEIQPEREQHSSRRRLLKWMIRAGYGAFAIAFIPPALAIRALTQAVEEAIAGDILVHAAGDQSGLPINLSALPAGTSTQAFPQGKSESSNNLIQLVRLPDPAGVVAYSAICTHLGCSVLPALTSDGYIICPCHASMFDPADNAAVHSGPAGKPLASLPIAVGDDGSITATGGFSGEVGPG